MADRYVRMNILTNGAKDAKKTLDQLVARARLLEAESPDLKITVDATEALDVLAKLEDALRRVKVLIDDLRNESADDPYDSIDDDFPHSLNDLQLKVEISNLKI